MSGIRNNDWEEFLKSNSISNIFQSPEFYQIFERTKNYSPLIISTNDLQGNISGILLAVIQKDVSGYLGRFTARSIIIGGPIIANNNPNVLREILKKYKSEIPNRAIYTQFRNLWDWGNLKDIFIEEGFEYTPHLDILIDTARPFDEIKKGISKNKCRNVTKSLNKSVFFSEISDRKGFDCAIKLIKNTYKRIKLPLPHDSFFKNAYDILAERNYLKTFGVFYNEKMLGCRIELTYNGIVYDWYAGSDPDHANFYPNDLLPYKILEWSSMNGYGLFDFGGAGKPNIPYGVRDHKMKFGGELVEFGRFEMVHKKLLMNIGKQGLKLYKLINGLRRR